MHIRISTRCQNSEISIPKSYFETTPSNVRFRGVTSTTRKQERILEIEGKELSKLLRSDSVDKDANYVLAEVCFNPTIEYNSKYLNSIASFDY